MLSDHQKILITGATGYVGSRLAQALIFDQRSIRLMARNPDHLKSKNVEFVKADVFDLDSLNQALQGVHTAYYLIHSLGSKNFCEQDRIAAQNFAKACLNQDVKRIIYLGGLGKDEQKLSEHLQSRQDVGRILRESGVPTIEFRASIIIGSGSLSFEMIRSLVEKLPVMMTPRWVRVKAQPIAIEDVIAYLQQACDLKTQTSVVYEIGGINQVSYGEIMQEYARNRHLKRFMISVPFLTSKLSSLWLGLVTPLYARIGKNLMTSLKNPTLVQNKKALVDFSIKPLSMKEAIRRAIQEEDQRYGRTRWCDAISSSGLSQSYGGAKFGSRVVDDHVIRVKGKAQDVFRPIQEIGGKRGWYYADWLWRLRGFLDLLVGGVGMRRGRADPHYLTVGEPLDFWRVEEIIPNQRLRLKAEMKLPGRAWLQFDVKQDGEDCLLEQTAIFDPVGLLGRMYWYTLYPLHKLIFRGMLKNISRKIQKSHLKNF